MDGNVEPRTAFGGVGTVAGFHAAMAEVERLGWDSQAAADLLSYAREQVIRPAVRSRRLFGDSYDEAMSVGWLAAWEVLRSPTIRTSSSPWGSVRSAVLRGVQGAYVAKIYKAPVRSGWRRSAAGTAPEPDDAALCVSLERELERGRQFAESATPIGLGRRLELICSELVAAGWEQTVAEEALDWIASNYSGSPEGTRTVDDRAMSQARTPAGDLIDAAAVVGDAIAYPNLRCPSCGAGVVAGCSNASREASGIRAFIRLRAGQSHADRCPHALRGAVRGSRFAATRLRIPYWQLRRLALVVGGGDRNVGLVELMTLQGPGLLHTPVARRSIRATTSRFAMCPSTTLAERYGAGQRPRQAAA